MPENLKIFKIKKLKKILFSFGFAKKSVVALILFTMMFGIFAPVCAHAGWLLDAISVIAPPIGFVRLQFAGANAIANTVDSQFEGVVSDFFNAILCGGAATLVATTSLPLSLAHSTLGWVTSDDFINVSFTGGKEGDANYNMVVDKGWKIVRNLVNMLIVLGFVIIGIATILGIQEYNAQKLLPALIAIALLINFTPVICGLMIDASNITMNHFLSGASLDRTFVETIGFQTAEILNPESQLSTTEKLGYAFVYAGLNLTGTIVFGLFAILFAVRYIALWILVILSPLAFFCYIFPKARGVWSAWWTQFFQWCIIGIPAAFFIYLSNILIAQMMHNDIVSSPTGEVGTTGFAGLFTLMIPFAFMVVGLFASFKTGAMGATMITSFAQTTGKKHVTKASKWAGGKASRFAKERAPAAMLRKLERTAAYQPKGKITGGLYKYSGAGWAARTGASALTSTTAMEKADISKFRDEAAKRTASKNLTAYRNPIATKSERIGILQSAIEKKQLKEWGKLGFSDDEKKRAVLKTGIAAIKIDPKEFSTIRNAFPHLAEEIKKQGKFNENVSDRSGLLLDQKSIESGGFKTIKESLVSGMSANDIKNIDTSIFKDEDAKEAMLRWNGQQIAAASKEHGRKFTDEFQKSVSEKGRKHFLKPENFNPDIINYLASSGALAAGLSSIEGGKVTPEEMKEHRPAATKYREKNLAQTMTPEQKKNIKAEDRKKMFPEETFGPAMDRTEKEARGGIRGKIGKAGEKIRGTGGVKKARGKIRGKG